jgi:hypothetical protein
MPRQPPETKVEEVALHVAEGLSLRAAAGKAGVPETTARRWSDDPGFGVRVAGHRRAIVGRTLGILTTASTKAAMALIKLLDDPDSEVKLKACRAVFADLIAVQNQFDLADQLRGLEAPADDHG